MSEYITLNVESSDDPNQIKLLTNLKLAPDGPETYTSHDEGDEGSPLAQTLFLIDGLLALDIDGGTLTIRRDPDVEWPTIIDDVTEALKDFFL